jgi:hypothetical protein
MERDKIKIGMGFALVRSTLPDRPWDVRVGEVWGCGEGEGSRNMGRGESRETDEIFFATNNTKTSCVCIKTHSLLLMFFCFFVVVVLVVGFEIGSC